MTPPLVVSAPARAQSRALSLFPPSVCGAADMADEQQQFYLLLTNLLSADNSARKQAEVRRGDSGGNVCCAERPLRRCECVPGQSEAHV